MTRDADAYFSFGCGRCALGGTPSCKVHKWTSILIYLRQILLETELTEDCKWGVPCYTYQGRNVVLLGAFKDYVSLSFLKGSLLKDEHALLCFAGENSQTAKVLKVTQMQKLQEQVSVLKSYIFEAIELEKRGEKVVKKKIEMYEYPSELQDIFEHDVIFKKAFKALSPGRQRGYLIFFSQPKQTETRIRRIEKYRSAIMEGKGLQD